MSGAARPNPALLVRLLLACAALVCGQTAFALDPSLDISQYAHTAWTVRDGFSLGNIYAMTQTPDGYLWLGTEFGLFRFDGVRSVLWQPPAGQHLPQPLFPQPAINSLLAARDGTLFIGTFGGLVIWSGGKLIRREEVPDQFVASLFEDHEGTVWVSTLGSPGRLCAIRSVTTQCYGEDGAFGRAVWAMYEDSSGNLWAAAQSGLWRWRPGPPKRYATATELIGLNETDEGRLLIAMHAGGLVQLVGDRLKPYPIRSAINSNELLRDRDVNSNRLLRDRDGGLWIGTVDRGLIHVHQGRTDVFTKKDDLSGDIILSLFEDREGNVWVATTGGLDRFRELPVATLTLKQGLADASWSVMAATDGSIWVGAPDGLTRWKNRQVTTFRKSSGLPDDAVHSLFQDDRGRVWASTRRGLAYFKNGRFVGVNGVPGQEVYSITGNKDGNLWLSENRGLLHLFEGRLVERVPWSGLGHDENASVLASGVEEGGVWLAFWGGGVSYFKDGQLRTSYTPANGLGEGPVADLQFDRDGALWAATAAGVSRIKDGRIATLTRRNGLPCDTTNWTVEDDDGSLWVYSACGLVRITRSELDAWIADPKRRIETTVWDAADGVRLRGTAASRYNPHVAKSIDGKLWFVTGEGVQVIDPRHLTVNKLPPPVRIEQIVADHKIEWQNLPGEAVSNLRLPAQTRDLTIDYTALSLVAPEKVHFKYRLEGQDSDWREVVNDRQVQYSNLAPGTYQFRVIASNNSGVWNEQGDTLEFSVAPAYYQTNWFRALCAVAVLLLLCMAYQLRVRQLHQQFEMTLEARVGERTRIARDLHDTLLQSFQGILLHLQRLSNRLQQGEIKQALDGTIDQAAQAIVEGRDAVQGLRASTVESNDLALAIRTLGEELTAADHISRRPDFSVRLEGTPRSLHPIVRDEVYRITGEGMRNGFRHAEAKQIEVEIHYDERQLRLRVRDNGKGIDPKLLSDDGRGEHFGLRGMRERAKLIGGKLAVWSELDAGTEVELRIPASRAYRAPAEGQRIRLTEKFFAKLSGRGTVKKS
jgi:signal transduction histidine kinase/ligand-binding sensor domain-containing protein